MYSGFGTIGFASGILIRIGTARRCKRSASIASLAACNALHSSNTTCVVGCGRRLRGPDRAIYIAIHIRGSRDFIRVAESNEDRTYLAVRGTGHGLYDCNASFNGVLVKVCNGSVRTGTRSKLFGFRCSVSFGNSISSRGGIQVGLAGARDPEGVGRMGTRRWQRAWGTIFSTGPRDLVCKDGSGVSLLIGRARGRLERGVLSTLNETITGKRLPTRPLPTFGVRGPTGDTGNSFSSGVTLTKTGTFGGTPEVVTRDVTSGVSLRNALFRGIRVTKPNFLGFCLSRECCSRVIGSIVAENRSCNTSSFNGNGGILIRFISTGPANPVRVNGTHNNTVNSYLTTILRGTNCGIDHRFCIGSTNGRVRGFTASLRIHCLRLCGSNVRVPRSTCGNTSVARRTGDFTTRCNSGCIRTRDNREHGTLISFTLPGGVTNLRESLLRCEVGCSG